MTQELITGLPATLAARAEQIAQEHHARRRRRRWRSGLAGLGVAVLVSSGAYAARGLWQPALGTSSTSSKARPVADGAPPTELALRHLAPLRRAQTPADRGNASRAALTWPADRYKILTNSVRQLGPLPDGRSAVLIPMISQSDGHHQLCLTVGREREADARACGTVRDLLDGGLIVATGSSPDPALESKLAAARRRHAGQQRATVDRWRAAHPGRKPPPGLGTSTFRLSRELAEQVAAGAELHLTGLVPDGVAQVRMTADGRRFPVTGNLFTAAIAERDAGGLRATFLDAAGKPLQPMIAPLPVARPTARQTQWLEAALARQVSPKLRGRLNEALPALVSACAVMRARPQVSDTDRQAAVASALRPVTGPLTPDLAAVATELVAAGWCLRRDGGPREP